MWERTPISNRDDIDSAALARPKAAGRWLVDRPALLVAALLTLCAAIALCWWNAAVPQWGRWAANLTVVAGSWVALVALALLGFAALGILAGIATAVGLPRSPGPASDTPLRQRLADGALLIVVCAWLCLLLGGALLTAAEMLAKAKPVIDQQAAAGAPASATRPPTLFEWASQTPRFMRWWGVRPLPGADGGSYTDVLSREQGETVVFMIGSAVSRAQKQGYTVSRVLIPRDLEALYGREPADTGLLVDGSEFKIGWLSLEEVAELFTESPMVATDYDPVLTEQHLATIPLADGDDPESAIVSIGEPASSASGTWVLHAIPGTPRRYVLVPTEASPIGQRP